MPSAAPDASPPAARTAGLYPLARLGGGRAIVPMAPAAPGRPGLGRLQRAPAVGDRPGRDRLAARHRPPARRGRAGGARAHGADHRCRREPGSPAWPRGARPRSCRGWSASAASRCPTPRPAAPTCPAGCASPPSRSARPTSSSARSSPPARASSPRSWSSEFKHCRDQVPPEPFAVVRRGRRGGPRPAARGRVRPLRPRRRWPRRRSPRCTRATLRTGEDVVVKVQRPPVGRARAQGPAGHGVARAASWSGASRSRRWPTRRRSSSCSPRRSPRSSTSASRPQNMLDVAAVLRRARPAGLRRPPPPPRARHPPGARDGAARRASSSTTSPACSDAGVDTEAVVRTGMIGFMEGAMIHGIFHGDLHGGNLFVLPDGRTALLDFGIIGRLAEPRRARLPPPAASAATTNDVTGQLAALRDLGALPPDTDLDAVITRPRPRPAAGRPHHADRRRAGQRDPAGR